jgi:predicted PurR-regulated permease PerM
MVRAIQGIGVLLLLSAFFAYVLAPAVAGLRRRVRIGRRKRPLSRASALLVLYAVLFAPAALVWRVSADRVTEWVRVTAPASVDRLFGRNDFGALDRLIAHLPFPPASRPALRQRLEAAIGYLEREVRGTLDDLIAAAPHAAWLLVVPVVAFLLLTLAPGFRRSTLRVLPHGHLNGALKSISGTSTARWPATCAPRQPPASSSACCAWLVSRWLQLPQRCRGVTAGVLELVPAIGPLTAMLVAATQRATASGKWSRCSAGCGWCRTTSSIPFDPAWHAHVHARRDSDDLARRGARRRRGSSSLSRSPGSCR